MGIWRYVNCSTCVNNNVPIKEYPCNECGKYPFAQNNEPFHNWQPKFTYEEMIVKKE